MYLYSRKTKGAQNMAFHEFGIMQEIPKGRYDKYEPEKYSKLVAVDMEIIDRVLTRTIVIPTYSHSIKAPFNGLNETGITLIPPDSATKMADLFEKTQIQELAKVTKLLRLAAEESKYVIHFGI